MWGKAHRLPDCIAALFTVVVMVGIITLGLYGPAIVKHANGAPSADDALLIAAGGNNPRAVKQAIDDGANVEAMSPVRMTPLMIACGAGDLESIRVLLDHHARTEAKIEARPSALHLACVFDKREVVQLLLDRGADPNSNCGPQTPLDSAEEFRRDEIAQLLRAHGARHGDEVVGQSSWDD
jgi:ankyrin repeat protein